MSKFLSNWFGLISFYWYFKLWCNFFIFFRIGRTTVCTNFGQEVFLFQKLVVLASKESLLKEFPQEWLHWIEVELACERKATKSTWYNAPAVLLAMLIWRFAKTLLCTFDATCKIQFVLMFLFSSIGRVWCNSSQRDSWCQRSIHVYERKRKHSPG